MKTQLKSLLLPLMLLVLLSPPNLASAYYDPGVQRWINRDPIGEQAGANLYCFVLNRPVLLVDTFGESIKDDLCDPCSKNKLGMGSLCKPKTYPRGTVPIDKFKPWLTREQIHRIKQRLGLGPKDWVGIDPDGNVIVNDGEGGSESQGNWHDYGPWPK